MCHFLWHCDGVKLAETHRNNAAPRRGISAFKKVLNNRGQPIRHLWVRNSRYYARMTVEDVATGQKGTRRIPLEKATTPAEARAELESLLVQRREKRLPVLKQAPKFNEFVGEYLRFHRMAKDIKRPSTVKAEEEYLRHWTRYLGETRLNKITRRSLDNFIATKQAGGWCGRTVNLGLTVLRNVLKKGVSDGYLTELPTKGMKAIKWVPKKRQLVDTAQLDKICKAALEVSKNGRQLADYLRLMAYCGSRMTETLSLRWEDVHWNRKQLLIGWDGQTKNHESRTVDFNLKLETLLKEMATRKAPDSIWIFPSPIRGEKDKNAKSFTESLRMAREAAGIPRFSFHDCRHHFISMCVMSGIDYMTIARWVGHKDGGILIGKVYGHLSNEHAQLQASRLVFK